MMQMEAPPHRPPRVALADDDGRGRLRALFWQLWLTMVTVLITAWLITLGPIPGVLAVVTAKHVLVAILVMGLNVDADRKPNP
jgi:Flp pilus assembly protein TadB